jgi:hypothetical protein
MRPRAVPAAWPLPADAAALELSDFSEVLTPSTDFNCAIYTVKLALSHNMRAPHLTNANDMRKMLFSMLPLYLTSRSSVHVLPSMGSRAQLVYGGHDAVRLGDGESRLVKLPPR